MKKVNLMLIMLSVIMITPATIQAQISMNEEIEQIFIDKVASIPNKNKDWLILADSLKEYYPLDVNNQISLTTIIEVPNKNKEQIFLEAHAWFNRTFVDAKSAIQMADKESNVIIAKGFFSGIGQRKGFSKNTFVSTYVLLRIDIKDEKVRLITTMYEYEMLQSTGLGLALMGGTTPSVEYTIKPWDGYPFSESNPQIKKEMSIGFASSIAASLWLGDKLNQILTIGVTGYEDDNW